MCAESPRVGAAVAAEHALLVVGTVGHCSNRARTRANTARLSCVRRSRRATFACSGSPVFVATSPLAASLSEVSACATTTSPARANSLSGVSSLMPSTSSSMRSSPAMMRSASARIMDTTEGHPAIAWIMSCRPLSIRFCDGDFARPRKQLPGPHLAHIHPDRISGTAELRIDTRWRRFRFLVRLIIGRRSRRGIVEQVCLCVRRLLVHGHPHVAERADDRLHRRRLRTVVRQVIVDFRVGEVAAVSAKRDQRAHLALALLVLARRGRMVPQHCDWCGPAIGRATGSLGCNCNHAGR